MAEEVPAFVNDTKQALESVVPGKKFAEKHLARPPFGFLKDVFTGISNATGFGSELFTPEELSAEMMIDYVQEKSGESIAAKPGKIVAGLEVEQTNQFLQILARTAGASSSSSSAAEPKKKRSSSKSKKASSEEGGETGEKKKTKKKAAADGEGGEKKTKKKAAAEGEEGEKKKKKKASAEEGAEPKKKKKAADGEAKPKKKAAAEGGEDKPKKKVVKKKKEAEDAPPRIAEPTPQPAMHAAAPVVEEPPRREEPPPQPKPEPRKEEAKPQIPAGALARPQTAGMAPPRIQSNVRTVEKAQEATPMVEKKTLVIEEGLEEEDDDDLDDLGLDDDEEDDNNNQEERTDASSEDAEAHGGLVRNIIEAAKGSDTPDNKKKEKTVKVDTLATNHHREVLQKEINKLRDSIQSLCKSANPLGKTMDYVQEDFENMAKELQKWQQESQQQVAKLEEEQRSTEQTLQPGIENLNELDIKIRDILIQINNAKAVIVKNDEVIHKMLSMVVNH